ncbi:hypothetical protein WS73_00365 [Burkholderia savannae]|nr:hypothetical protein WS73_00365 [Burkholderia savannae]
MTSFAFVRFRFVAVFGQDAARAAGARESADSSAVPMPSCTAPRRVALRCVALRCVRRASAGSASAAAPRRRISFDVQKALTAVVDAC